jgi:hypothetical protein
LLALALGAGEGQQQPGAQHLSSNHPLSASAENTIFGEIVKGISSKIQLSATAEMHQTGEIATNQGQKRIDPGEARAHKPDCRNQAVRPTTVLADHVAEMRVRVD